MAVQTGTAADDAALINVALKAFATSPTNGWTLNEDSWPEFMALSNGSCFVNFRRRGTNNATATGNNTFNDGNGLSTTDNRLRVALSSAYSSVGASASARYRNQPNSVISSSLFTINEVLINDLTGPFTSYTLYSGGPSDPPYIYGVFETIAGYYVHLGFGEVDALNGAFATIPTFLFGSYYEWWPINSSLTSPSNNNWFWGDSAHNYGFSASNNEIFAGSAETTTQDVRNSADILPLFTRHNEGDYLDPFTGSTTFGRWASSIFALGPLALNGVTPFLPILCAYESFSVTNTWHPVGVAPNVRLCSMIGRQPGEIVTIGNDEWQLWPMRRLRQDRGSVPLAERTNSPPYENTSSIFGIAHKRVV